MPLLIVPLFTFRSVGVGPISWVSHWRPWEAMRLLEKFFARFTLWTLEVTSEILAVPPLCCPWPEALLL